jgi:predicted short-subunit dehydrogenase-like oxidoreductase (DUF2520 family)
MSRSRVIVIGSGRMAGAFERSLRAARITPVRLRARAPRWRVPSRSAREARLMLLAVTDAAIAEVAAKLSAQGLLARGDTVVHLAGMRGPEEISLLRATGASVGALHPLVAVAARRSATRLEGYAATFEGDPRAWTAVRAMAARIGLRVHRLHAVDRARYHAAAALCATGGVALAQSSTAVFRTLDPALSERTASRFAASLLASVAHNVAREGASQALASPLLRGDTAAVARHLAAMEVHPPAVALYRAALAQVIAALDAGGAVDAAVLDRARALVAGAEAVR